MTPDTKRKIPNQGEGERGGGNKRYSTPGATFAQDSSQTGQCEVMLAADIVYCCDRALTHVLTNQHAENENNELQRPNLLLQMCLPA